MLARIRFIEPAVPAVPGVLVLLLTVYVSAQMPDLREPQPTGALPPGGTGVIAGQVLDPGTGKAVPEALVTLRISGIPSGPESPRVLTDAQGRFVFVNVPAGRFNVLAQKLGYAMGSSGQRTPRGGPFDFLVTDGQILPDVAVPLWKHAAIGGTVTDEAGQPVVGVRVDAFRKTFESGEIRLTTYEAASQGGATTDDRGVYRLPNLQPGEYAVGVLLTLTTFPAGVMAETQGTGSLRSQAYFVARDIVGPLGDPRTQQVGDFAVVTGSRTPLPPAPGALNAASVYRTTFSPGTPLPSEATLVTVGSGEEKGDMNLTLRPWRASRVSGRLLGPDGPVAFAGVHLFASGKWQVGSASFFLGATATAMTDAAGNFTILGVPDGEYLADVRRPNPTEASTLHTAEVLSVAGADITDWTVTARPSARMIGRVDLHGGKPPPPGYLWVIGQTLRSGSSTLALRPGPDLTFSSHVPPGAYTLMLPDNPEVGCTSVMVGGRDISDAVFVMGTEDVVDVTVHCNNPTTRLSGTVRDQRGAADPASAIVVFPVERQFWSGASFRARRLQRVYADKSGAFMMRALPAGEYFVAAIPDQKADVWQDPKLLDALTRSATRVTLGSGESRTVDLRTVQIK